jgi:hypothetical protein
MGGEEQHQILHLHSMSRCMTLACLACNKHGVLKNMARKLSVQQPRKLSQAERALVCNRRGLPSHKKLLHIDFWFAFAEGLMASTDERCKARYYVAQATLTFFEAPQPPTPASRQSTPHSNDAPCSSAAPYLQLSGAHS